jgi:hypothetical protein
MRDFAVLDGVAAGARSASAEGRERAHQASTVGILSGGISDKEIFSLSGCPDGQPFKRRESRQHPLNLVGDDETFVLRDNSVLRLAFFVIAPSTHQSSISYSPARTPLQQTSHFIKVDVTSSVLNFLDSLAYSLAALGQAPRSKQNHPQCQESTVTPLTTAS